jgi:hypothetical protein
LIVTTPGVWTSGTPTFCAQEHTESGSRWADSAQLPGFVAVAADRDELFRLVREAPEVYLGWPAGGYSTVLITAAA